jgi:predicted ATPase
MWLKKVSIKNFRSIEHISIDFDKRANVIVGPNAIGKTTLLEAIRLTKAMLAPRTQNEAQQTLISLGAISPHNPMRFNYEALARDVSHSLEIEAMFELTSNETEQFDKLIPNFANAVIRAGIGNSANGQGQIDIIQYLSSQEGQEKLIEVTKQIERDLITVKNASKIELNLTIEANGTIFGKNQLDQIIFSTFENNIPIHESLFSYFPADRAMPAGEVHIQIGGPDTAAQLETHNSQPQTKYHRLKPTIVNSFIFNEITREKLKENFEKIFSKVLKNRSLIGLSINEIGLISIKIKESIGNRTFDIDGMSSGEKGLILTFLLISHSIHQGGIIMIDEPELHLNPAVCKTLLTFLIEEYLVPNDIQAIICSHSPEILGSAFDSPDCTLFHIQSSTIISKIYSEDRREVFDALLRLGTSASDALFSAGSIFVEGDHDIEILETGFDELLCKYKITQLGGRGSIEKEIKTLQKAEVQGEIDTLKCFIFDLDNAPSELRSTRLIKVLQWKRRCIENYLIDEKTIYDLLKDSDISKKKINSRGEVLNVFKKIAENQLQEVVAKEVYNQMNYENPGVRPRELVGKTYDEIASILFSRLKTIQDQVNELNKETWEESFKSKCNIEHINQKDMWDSDWIAQCDGKRFFLDLYKEYEIKVSPIKFKKMIIERMLRGNSETWIVIEKLLKDALEVEQNIV